jgi:MFS family permease
MSFTLAHRDLSLVVTAKTLSLLGDEVATLALVLHLQSTGAGALAVAALLIAALVPLVLLAPLVGRLVDAQDSRRLLVTSSLAQAAVCSLLAYQTSTPVILALVGLLGAGQAVNGATWQALLPSIVGTDGLPRALGLSQAAATVASILSPALAGVLTGAYGARVPLLLDAATFLAITVAGLLVSTRRGAAVSTIGPGARTSLGLRLVRADPMLRVLLAMLALFVTLGSMVNVVEVFLVRETLHASSTWYGITGGVFAVGMLGGAVGAGRLRGDGTMARSLVGGATVLALGLAAMAAAPSVYWLLPIVTVLGVANGVLNVALGALVMGRAAEAVRGRIAATVSAVASASQIGAYVLGGVLAIALTPRAIFLLAGVFGLLAPLVLGRGLIRAASAGAKHPADCEVTTVEGVLA